HLPDVATFVAGPPHPPTRFDDGAFDFIYCISLFTHLDEPMQDEWLDEIHRLLKPGGHLLATTHGALATGSCTARELEALASKGFVFRTSRRRFKLDGLPDFYQTTFHARWYVERHWGRRFRIVSYAEGG